MQIQLQEPTGPSLPPDVPTLPPDGPVISRTACCQTRVLPGVAVQSTEARPLALRAPAPAPVVIAVLTNDFAAAPPVAAVSIDRQHGKRAGPTRPAYQAKCAYLI